MIHKARPLADRLADRTSISPFPLIGIFPLERSLKLGACFLSRSAEALERWMRPVCEFDSILEGEGGNPNGQEVVS